MSGAVVCLVVELVRTEDVQAMVDLLKRSKFEVDTVFNRRILVDIVTADDWAAIIRLAKATTIAVERVVKCREPGIEIILPHDSNFQDTEYEEIEFKYSMSQKQNLVKRHTRVEKFH